MRGENDCRLRDSAGRYQFTPLGSGTPKTKTPEEIREERRKIKSEYDDLFDSLTALLFRNDPIGINFDDNIDEYEPEPPRDLADVST